jgi:glycosyltransferase involved in cell wall biosynthesis
MVFISILTPVYNGIEFLEQCINSVRYQTYPDWEMLIGINGHGDDGGEVGKIADKLAQIDSRIRVIIQGTSIKGKVESLNHLVTLLQTEWVAILDCDDIWDSKKLERQIYTMYHEAPDAVVIGTFCQYFGEKHGRITLDAGYIEPDVLEKHNPIINSSAIIKRTCCHWELNDINAGMDDYHLWMKICLSGGKLYNIPHYLVWHQIHRNSAFNSKSYSNEALQTWYKNERIKLNRMD